MQAACKLECMCVTHLPADLHKPLTCATGMSYRTHIKGSPPPLPPLTLSLLSMSSVCLDFFHRHTAVTGIGK